MAEDFGLSFKPMKLPRQKRRKKQEQPQEIDPTILQSLGGGVLGLAGAAGNALSLPGSSVVDVLAGKNPFDQWVTPFSDANRTSGRELLRQYGMAGKKDTWGNFAAGLAVDIGTDPTTLLGLSPLGKTAKGIGMLKSGQKLTKGVGAGIRSGERAIASGKVPFGPRWQLGTGETAAKIGDKIDAGWEAVRSSAPGRYAAAAFEPSVLGKTNRKVQQSASDIVYPQIQDVNKRSRAMMIDIAKRLKRIGATDSDSIRAELEGVEVGIIHQKDPSLLVEIRNHLENERELDRYWGRPARSLEDVIGYHPRYLSLGKRGKGEAAGKTFSGIPQSDKAREMALKGWFNGTNAIKGFFKDQDLAEMSQWMEEQRRAMVQTAPLEDIAKTDKAFINQMTNAIKQKYAGEFEPGFEFKGKMYDRARELAKTYLKSSNITRKDGLYTNNPLIDLFKKTESGGVKRAKIQGVINTLVDLVPGHMRGTAGKVRYTSKDVDSWSKMKVGRIKKYHPADATDVGSVSLGEISGTPNVNSLFMALKMPPKKMAGILLRESGSKVTPRNMKIMLETEIPQDIYDDLASGYDKTVLPKSIEGAMSIPDQGTNLFRAGVLTHPARHFRDAMGGYLQNLIHGLTSPRSRFREAKSILEGKSIKGLTSDPEIQQWVSSQGLPLNDETASEAIRYLYASEGPGSTFKHTDVTGTTNPSAEQSIEDILAQVPGENKKTSGQRWKEIGKTLLGGTEDSTWNLGKAHVRGVNKRDKSTFAPFAASDKTGEWSDQLNRLDPFIQLKKKGYTARAAMNVINDVQANYDPSTFTAAEKQIFKRLFPFYSYSSRMAKHVGKELATNPGGGLANTIKLQNSAQDKSGTTPDHIADTASIPDPFYKSKDGSKQYLTSLGLMHEDSLNFMQPSPRAVTGEVLSRMNPLLQKAIELGTGTSLFFKEPNGGRPVDELDPTIGRILANVTGSDEAVRYPGDWLVETANSLSPTSRLATTVRQLTDTRKSTGSKLLNTFTGMKVTTVSPQQQERTLRRKLEEVARSLGGRTFEQIYFPESKTYTGEAKERVEAYKTVINALSKRAKDRAKDKLKK